MSRLAVVLVALVLAVPTASAPGHTPASNGWIVFASDRVVLPYTSYGLYRLEPIGGTVTRLGALGGQAPSWSPDGSLIAFSDRRQRLVVANADGTNARTLTSRPVIAEEPSWSPDGSRIVFQHAIARGGRGRDLAVINSDGTGKRLLTHVWHDDLQPSWSPDGSLIAFSSNRGPLRRPYDSEIYAMRPNGRGVRALTRNRVADFSPSWSPDGRRIAFSSARGALHFNTELWTMRSDGAGERRVMSASDPNGSVWYDHSASWSPDGNWLVYASNQAVYPDNVFIVRPDGQGEIDLTPGTNSHDFDPAWQPVCSHPGTAGPDRLRGTLADDRLCGFGGGDTIRGGTGRDGLYGGDGNDVLRARDGSFDVVGCGPGRDVVVADRVDLVGLDCERIRRR